MRRSRFNQHPAQRTALGELGLYEKPGRCESILVVGGTPSETLFQNMPVLLSAGLIGVHVQLNQFLSADDIAATKWTSLKNDDSPAAALRSGAGGGVLIRTSTMVGDSFHVYHAENETVQFEQGKSSWIQFNMAVAGGGTTFWPRFGFHPDDELGIGLHSDNGFLIDFYEGTYFSMQGVADTEYWSRVDSDDDLLFMPEISDAAFHNWGIHVEPSGADPTLFNIMVFFDGCWLLTEKGVALPNVPLHPYLGTLTHNDTITLRSILIIQED